MAGSATRGGRPPRYRKRRPLPALLLVAVLGLAAAIVWLRVLQSEAELTVAPRCNPPATPPSAASAQPPTTRGQALNQDALDRVPPAPPSQAKVRVFNGSSQRGQAGTVTEELRQLGFTQLGKPANDPLYGPNLDCRAQIRFGQQGSSAARTLSLVDPCAELVRDERQDATVELVLGKQFDDLRPRSEARTALTQLTDWAADNPGAQGGLQANGTALPTLDTDLLTAARMVNC